MCCAILAAIRPSDKDASSNVGPSVCGSLRGCAPRTAAGQNYAAAWLAYQCMPSTPVRCPWANGMSRRAGYHRPIRAPLSTSAQCGRLIPQPSQNSPGQGERAILAFASCAPGRWRTSDRYRALVAPTSRGSPWALCAVLAQVPDYSWLAIDSYRTASPRRILYSTSWRCIKERRNVSTAETCPESNTNSNDCAHRERLEPPGAH